MSLVALGLAVYSLNAEAEATELGDLAKAQGVALAKVVKVTQKSDAADEVTIKIVSVLKGNVSANELTLEMQTRGDAGQDPVLKVDDMGVFFLKSISGTTAKLAYSGSVSVFPKPELFKVSDKPAVETGAGATKVKLETSMGDIVLELDDEKAPVTVENFLRYVNEGHYNGTVFHRVIKDFMVQGGGFTAGLEEKPTHEPIVNEAKNGLKNLRGTIAMARTNNPNSATSQFFINHKNNPFLDYVQGRKDGYAVFAKVVEGMDVVDAIANVRTTTRPTARRGPMKDVPAQTVLIKSATIIATK
jgi:cyclophilin family peptidyl-prolyl cis-trans isomerase